MRVVSQLFILVILIKLCVGVPPTMFSVGVDTDPTKRGFRSVAFPMANELGINGGAERVSTHN